MKLKLQKKIQAQ